MSEESTDMVKELKKSAKRENPPAPRGLDVGTMHLCSAMNKGDKVETKKIRDAFIDLEADAKKMLKMSNVSFIEKDDIILIIGDDALHTANIFKREVRRPLSKGVVSSSEIDAFEVLGLMIKQLLGAPKVKGEPVYYSVPAAPIDNPEQDVLYHENIFKRIINNLGFNAVPMNEAVAICYADCATEGFSGLTISFGAGMVNCALTYQTMPAFSFSVARGGDWIDAQSAKAVNSTASRMAVIKEKEFDPEKGTSTLVDPFEGEPKNMRQREAISVYYRGLINYALDNIVAEFKKHQDDIELPEAIPLVVSGGTTMPKGFVDIFKEELESRKGFPIDISEVRQANDPLMAVCKGLLVAASVHDEDE